MNWRSQFSQYADRACLWKDGAQFSYSDLLSKIELTKNEIAAFGIKPGDTVFLRGDFNLNSMAAFFALAEARCIVVPHSGEESEVTTHQRIAGCTVDLDASAPTFSAKKIAIEPSAHDLVLKLKAQSQPGLILFSSGSAGEPKAILHSLEVFFRRYEGLPQVPHRIAAFLLFDHIGGLNTLLMTLATGGELINLPDRSVQNVFRILKESSAEVLPCSPTFLRLALTSLQDGDFALPDLKVVTYGTEVMPPTILDQLVHLFPGVRFKQTYGLSEIGILRTKSQDSTSTWMKIGDEKTRWRVVDELLEIQTPTSMMGYLNAPTPFTDDRWYRTGDRVEVNGDLIRVLGRESGIINVGGLKVLPSEVENFLSKMSEIEDVVVTKEKHLLLGEIVVAHLKIHGSFSTLEMAEKIQLFCRGHLSEHKIPQKIVLHDESLFTTRFKKRSSL